MIPSGSANRHHGPGALVFTDAADRVVAVRGEPIEEPLKVVHFESHAAQPQFIRHGLGRSWFVVWANEASQF